MNIFETYNLDLAYNRLMLEAKQDYRPDLVKCISVNELFNFSFIKNEMTKLDCNPIDIGLSEHVPVGIGVKACIMAAALQYCFWEVHQTKGLIRYSKDNKSGSEIVNDLISDHVNFSVNINKNPFIIDSTHFLNLEHFPLGVERLRDVQEIASKFDPRDLIENIIDLNKVTVHQAFILNKLFQTFEDPYLKKAQLALSFIVGFLNKKGYKIDQSELTIFADYQVPRVMQQIGLLKYDNLVHNVIENNGLILENSITEKAIRSATVLVGENCSNLFNVPSASIDKWLWLQRKTCTLSHHLTITKRY